MPKIVVIEDDATMLALLKTLMEMEGYQVAAIDGLLDLETLLAMIRLEMPDLVLMDVHLRNTNGFELMQAVRKDDQMKKLVVLMSSGMEVGEQCRQAGADGFMLKPYMPDDLLVRIRQALPTVDT
jgi:CheY-like chemotaxis protein